MIKFQDLKAGDYVLEEFEGKVWEGEVTNFNRDEKEVCVKTEAQEFWYKPEELRPIPLDEDQLMKLSFTKEAQDDGSAKYKKGAFRILVRNNDFSNFEIWYRDEKRLMTHSIAVHDLQNHYLDMTKVHLTNEVFAE